jgi:K+-transporting ATPase c subunit
MTAVQGLLLVLSIAVFIYLGVALFKNAAIQVNRVAAARHISPAAITKLVRQYTTGRPLGFLGEATVDVLKLNIALDAKYPV